MLKTLFAACIFCAFSTITSLAQQPVPEHFGNSDVVNLLKSGVPESAILSEIELMARRGIADFDLSPSTLVDLQHQGVSEKVLDVLFWAQTEIVPAMGRPILKGVFYGAPENAQTLPMSTVFPQIRIRWASFPFVSGRDSHVALDTPAMPLAIREGAPTLRVQGFSPNAGWQIVTVGNRKGKPELRVNSKRGFWSDFFSDEVFEPADVHPVVVALADPGSFTIRPASPLTAGAYALCAQAQDAGVMRVCYSFDVAQ